VPIGERCGAGFRAGLSTGCYGPQYREAAAAVECGAVLGGNRRRRLSRLASTSAYSASRPFSQPSRDGSDAEKADIRKRWRSRGRRRTYRGSELVR
jgi:hypothetical protein